MPLVSVVTPVYNAARWLPETLASVRAQTMADWEQILVDDGSTDNSVAIAEAAAREDARIRPLRTPRNLGPSVARNLAIDAARGRFIAFLDADDLWLPEKLARSVEGLTAHWPAREWRKPTEAAGLQGLRLHDLRFRSKDGAQGP